MSRSTRHHLGGTVVLGAALGAVALLRSRSLRWGVTDGELTLAWPGDDLMTDVDLISTRAVTIHAPAEDVWPWIAQLGQGRGGFYSYDFLENFVGCDIHSSDTVVADWQDIHVGSEVRLAPDVALTVALVEPERALVLRGGIPMGEVSAPYDFTWAFALRPTPEGSTRLVVRERYTYRRRWAALLVEAVQLVSLVMSQRMLHGIKQRAERTVHPTPAHEQGVAAGANRPDGG